MAESQLSELQNMRVLLEEEARLLARNPAYNRRTRLKAAVGAVLEEVDCHSCGPTVAPEGRL